MSGPKRLGTLLGGWNVRGGARADLSPDARAAALASAWEQAVGTEIARRSRPSKLANGVLSVLTASSAWSAELTFLAPKIVEALRRAVPEADLRRLRFSVASGRTRLLLEGARHATTPRLGSQARAGHAAATTRTSARGKEDPAATVLRLAAAQRSLDEWRDHAGWSTCASCGKRCAPARNGTRECAPCSADRRRREEAKIERVLMAAPWLSLASVRESLPETRAAAYRRTKQRLATRWQNELFAAERRLRRGAVTVHDRVAAWSFLMLQTGTPERDIGRAVVHDVLGSTWTNVLFARAASADEEARTRTRENLS